MIRKGQANKKNISIPKDKINFSFKLSFIKKIQKYKPLYNSYQRFFKVFVIWRINILICTSWICFWNTENVHFFKVNIWIQRPLPCHICFRVWSVDVLPAEFKFVYKRCRTKVYISKYTIQALWFSTLLILPIMIMFQ